MAAAAKPSFVAGESVGYVSRTGKKYHSNDVCSSRGIRHKLVSADFMAKLVEEFGCESLCSHCWILVPVRCHEIFEKCTDIRASLVLPAGKVCYRRLEGKTYRIGPDITHLRIPVSKDITCIYKIYREKTYMDPSDSESSDSD